MINSFQLQLFHILVSAKNPCKIFMFAFSGYFSCNSQVYSLQGCYCLYLDSSTAIVTLFLINLIHRCLSYSSFNFTATTQDSPPKKKAYLFFSEVAKSHPDKTKWTFTVASFPLPDYWSQGMGFWDDFLSLGCPYFPRSGLATQQLTTFLLQ